MKNCHLVFSLIFVFVVSAGLRQAVVADENEKSIADAAEQNDLTSVLRLIEKGVDVNQPQVDGMTAIHWAVHHENGAMVKKLTIAKANVSVTNRYGVHPLFIACTNGNAEIVKTLLAAGADPNTTLPGGETPLMTASRTGREKVVEELLERGAKVNAKGPRQQTALMWAAAEGNLKTVDALLKSGADFRSKLGSGFDALFFAVREGKTEVAIRLLDAGMDVNASMRRNSQVRTNPLLLAVENAHYETAIALLKAGADPNAQPRGHGALHAISWVRKPIRGDGNPSPVGSRKVSDLQFVKMIVKAGGDVNLKLAKGKSGFADFTTTGSTPLVLAARTGDVPLLKLLLVLGADPTLTNRDGSTALLAACGIGDLGSGHQSAGSEDEAIEVARILLKTGADVNATDKNQETAMHGASYQNWPKLVAFLADQGAIVDSWNQKNRWGWTPLSIARGYRKGNFRPDLPTIQAIEKAMLKGGVTPPPPTSEQKQTPKWDKKKTTPKSQGGNDIQSQKKKDRNE